MELNEKIVIYQTEDENTSIDVKLENETVWLTPIKWPNYLTVMKKQSVNI